MANQNLLTYNAKVSSVEQVYFSPVVVVPPAIDTPLGTIYCFLAKVEPWNDENNPPVPAQDTASIKKVFKNIFAVKLVQINDISPVVPRVDWSTGTVYDYYRDDVDMFATNTDGSNVLNFYVKNKYDQIFKCLWNNNGGQSTNEPYFEPGSYGTDNIFTGSDGYKWKFLYTVDTGSKVKFMDTKWIPVPVGTNNPSPLITAAGAGSIDVMNIIDGGSGYDPANAVVNVVVTGDGVGAAGTAIVDGGQITDIIVTNPGTNYSYANVSIQSSLGSGASVIAPTSPIGGHGFDPVPELGTSHVMFTSQFNGDENGLIPTDITYHQVGLITSPTTMDLNPLIANGTIYKTTTDFIVAPGFGEFTNDEIVYQGATLEQASFTGTVLSFDDATNVVRILNTTGTPTTNAPVFGNTSKTVRTLLSYSTPNFVIFSGYLSYIENRTGIQRSVDGIEQVKIVLGY